MAELRRMHRKSRRIALCTLAMITLLPLILLAALPSLVSRLLPGLLSNPGSQLSLSDVRWQQLSPPTLGLALHLQQDDRLTLSLPSISVSLGSDLKLRFESRGGDLMLAAQKAPHRSAPGSPSAPIAKQPSRQTPGFALPLEIEQTALSVRSAEHSLGQLALKLALGAEEWSGQMAFTPGDDDAATLRWHYRTDTQTLHSTLMVPLQVLNPQHPSEASINDAQALAAECEGVLALDPVRLQTRCRFTAGSLHRQPASTDWLRGHAELALSPEQLRITGLRIAQTEYPLPAALAQHLFADRVLWPEQLEFSGQIDFVPGGFEAHGSLGLNHPLWQAHLAPHLAYGPTEHLLTLPIQGHYRARQDEATLAGELFLSQTADSALPPALLPGSTLTLSSLHLSDLRAQQIRLMLDDALPLNGAQATTARVHLNAEGLRHAGKRLPDVRLQLLTHALMPEKPVPLALQLLAPDAPPIPLQGLLEPRSGRLTLASERLAILRLQPLLAPMGLWPEALAIEQGRLSTRLRLDTRPHLKGELELILEKLSARLEPYRLEQLDARLRLPFDHQRWRSGQGQIALAALDTGLPLQNLYSRVHLDGPFTAPALTLADLQLQLLGGTLRSPRLTLDPRQAHTSTVTLEALDFARIAALYDQPGLFVQGRISGRLPLTLGPEGAALSDGALWALPPGGVIRLAPTPAISTLKEQQPSLALAFDLMEHLNFDDLRARASLTHAGQLDLEAQLKGSNPALFAGRAIHFNYHHQENLIQLLRSLQLADEIHSGLDRHFNPSPDAGSPP